MCRVANVLADVANGAANLFSRLDLSLYLFPFQLMDSQALFTFVPLMGSRRVSSTTIP